MNKIQSVLIRYILRADDDHLKKMFIAANVFAGGLIADRDALDNVSEEVITHLQTMTEEERNMTLKYIHALKGFREVTA